MVYSIGNHNTTQFLQEEDIKTAALNFLKTYYRNRQRGEGDTTVKLNMHTPDGIKVDGYYAFKKPDGSNFVATVEATAAATATEVRFKLQDLRLLWDSIAVGGILAFLGTFLAFLAEMWSLYTTGWAFSLLLVLAIFGISMLGFQMFSRTSERYRIIQVIEQFKQYHADEQWVALGEDVFEHSEDTSFVELKRQIVENGFGLLIVGANGTCDALITPAREEVFGKKRQVVKLLETPLVRTAANVVPTTLERFNPSYSRQMAVFGGSLLALASLFYRQAQQPPVGSISVYQHQQAGGNTDGSTEPNIALTNKDYEQKANPSAQPYNGANVAPESVTHTDVFYVETPEGYKDISCSNRLTDKGQLFFIKDCVLSKFELVKDRIETLRAHGIVASAISLECSKENRKGCLVYYESIFRTEAEAQKTLTLMVKALRAESLSASHLEIMSLNF